MQILMCGGSAYSGGLSAHTRNLTRELSNLGVQILSFSLSGTYLNNLEPSKSRKVYQRTIGLIIEASRKRDKYDIIHIQTSGGIFSFISALTGILIKQILCKPLVVTFHYSQTDKFISDYPFIFNLVLDQVNHFIVVSNRQKQSILRRYPQYSNKISVIPNGYTSELFYRKDMSNCRSLLNLPNDKKIILMISDLTPTKGHIYLIKAIKELLNYRSDIICIIMGKGNLRNELEALVHDLGLGDYVKFIGWTPEKDVPIWMNACDIFVLPSLAEGNPTVMFECLGCGKPFIGTNVGGIPEVIMSDDYGLICTPANCLDLKEKISIAIDKTWNANNICLYSKGFTWESIAKATMDVYSKLGRGPLDQ
jgi:glycosyltransferase involved in cell wall biosynthesis